MLYPGVIVVRMDMDAIAMPLEIPSYLQLLHDSPYKYSHTFSYRGARYFLRAEYFPLNMRHSSTNSSNASGGGGRRRQHQ